MSGALQTWSTKEVAWFDTQTQFQHDGGGGWLGQGHGSTGPLGDTCVIRGGESVKNGCAGGQCPGAPGGSKPIPYTVSQCLACAPALH